MRVTVGEGRSGSPLQTVVRRAVVRFATWSVLTLVAVAACTVVVGAHVARDQALREARAVAVGIASSVAAPLVNHRVRAHLPGAGDELTAVLRNRMSDGSISHVKLWAADGRVIWADETNLVGRRFPLPEDVRDLFGTRRATADLSDLTKPENVGEREEGQLLEVYAGTRDADGRPLVFEAYMSTVRMQHEERAIVGAFLPLLIGALLLFLVAVLPLALSLARRVERGEVERLKMMRHALLASDLERRRIAQDLHDGVIQDLAGLGYALPAVEARLARGAGVEDARAALSRATGLLQHDVAALRTLVTDIYPPDLDGDGLVMAVRDLASSTAAETGVQVDVQGDRGVAMSPDAARLAYRVIREGLRNVAKHAEARRATVEVRRVGDAVTVRVSDDGRGMTEPGRVPNGHFGLRLLEDTLRDFDGRLDVRATQSGGTSLTAVFPAALVPA